MERIHKAISVSAPLRAVYTQWTQFEQYALFMQGIKRVEQVDDTLLRWTADVAGTDVSWTAKIVEQVPDRLVAWRSTSGRANNGRVQFIASSPDETLVGVTMEVEPEGCFDNAGDARGLVERRVEGDLVRFKKFIERRVAETEGWRRVVHRGREATSASS
jgi:uncharacterized membrane protein